MKIISYRSVLIIPLIIAGCIEKFTPSTVESKFYLVVDGLITNQPEVYTIKLSWSIPLGINTTVPLGGCDVTVHDDLGHSYQFAESSTTGTYISDSTTFQGVVGRKYSLHINTNNATPKHYSYESVPVEMKPVPPIDSLFYEKVLIKKTTPTSSRQEGCQIYLNAHEPNGDCRFYKWDYTETWKFIIPYTYRSNQQCWISNNSNNIDVKNTLELSEDRVIRHPVLFISNETDRLLMRYSIIVNQYSLSENEYGYWEKIKDISQDIGGLYDKIPFSIPSNMFCVEDLGEQVLGYFSVSARTSKRIFIDDTFYGLLNPFRYCEDEEWRFCINCTLKEIKDTINIPSLNQSRWIIIAEPGRVIITYNHACVDCTARSPTSTTTRPEFWTDWTENKEDLK
jgi:hypothetical protein